MKTFTMEISDTSRRLGACIRYKLHIASDEGFKHAYAYVVTDFSSEFLFHVAVLRTIKCERFVSTGMYLTVED